MAAHLRPLGSGLRSSAPLLKTKIMGNQGLSTLKNPRPLPYKEEVANYVKNRWSSLNLENRTMLKQSFINLTVPAVYSGLLWLLSAGADIVKDTLLNRGTLDDPSTMQLPTEVESLKEDLDEKLIQLFKAFEDSVKGKSDIDKLKEIVAALKDEKETKESQIIMLREKLHEKDAELEMFKDLLAGRMRQVGIVWFKYFAKNLNNSSLLSYYDPPEHTGLIYWHQN